jgi:immune inhibitor A
MAGLYAEYLRRGKPYGLTFKQYLEVIGFTNVAEGRIGMDDGAVFRAATPTARGPELIRVPTTRIDKPIRVKVLLVDFSDRPGTTPPTSYESMLFSKGTFPTGSMRDFFLEASLGKVDVTGSIHGWLRMPQTYAYYTNGTSGVEETYPRNAQGLAEHAVRRALESGVNFERELDALAQGAVTALFIVHAGVGAETQSDATLRASNIWSHKWAVPNPVVVGTGLQVSVYLTVPHDAKVGVCAHELGHLAFQWEDFYDPNYDADGSEWDGSGDWDLMAGGSWNAGGTRPAHPAALHKAQHGWIDVEEVKSSKSLVLEPYTKTSGKAVKIVSSAYRAGQYLLLENRKKTNFDSDLPGEGLLVWRVDEATEMFKPDRPALLLLQADGRHDLERSDDWNEGDAGDPFPGSALRTELDDQGDLSTTFPGASSSGVALKNIKRDAATGRVTLDVQFGGAPADGGVVSKTVEPKLPIPDNVPAGVESAITLEGAGTAREIAVDVGIRHAYVGDLRIELAAPSGVRALLRDRSGGNTANVEQVFRSSEVPSLAALVGENVAGAWRLRVTDLASADVGTLERFGIAIGVDRGSSTIVEKRTPKLAIPDKDAAGIADTLAIAREGSVKTLSVRVDVTHSYVQDLRIELVGPTGATALLHNRTGGSAHDVKRVFSSADTPALAGFVGGSVRGSWALRVADMASRDVGMLNAWELEIALSSLARVTQREAAPNAAIPDNSTAGIGSALPFDATGTVQALELACSILHPYIGDLRVELVAPSGKVALLHDRVGGRTRDLVLGISSATSTALASLVGQPCTGNWVLRVIDLATADAGTLRAWSLRLTHS